MLENILINNPQISNYLSNNDYAEASKILMQLQLSDWELAAKGFESSKFSSNEKFYL